MQCIDCGEKFTEQPIYRCKKCGGLLEIKFELRSDEFDLKKARKRKFNLWRYIELISAKRNVSLNEGGTPLYECKNLSEMLNVKLFVKNEGANPTGSFKDRGMTVGVSKAIEFGRKITTCASTGNTSASLAAYSARGNLKCIVLIPSGKIAYGKLAQALVFGAKVISIEGNFDKAFEMVFKISDREGIYSLNSINPYRLEGQKTLGFEIFDELNHCPDRVILPVGSAGNISAIWKGFEEFYELGISDKKPKMTGIQAEKAMPIVNMFKNKSEFAPVKNPETIATAIRIGNPVSWKKAINAIYESNGYAESVTDEEILHAQKLLAQKEGIFVEPASASSIAGLIKLRNEGIIDKNEEIVCVTTGNGLKDPDTVVNEFKDNIIYAKEAEIKNLVWKI